MTAPTSLDVARQAVEAALLNTTGRTRSLLTEDLFYVAFPEGVEGAARTGETIERKRVFVSISQVSHVEPYHELDPLHRYSVTIALTRWYYCGSQVFASEYAAAMDTSLSDLVKLRFALGFPNVLDTVHGTGEESGIDGGALTYVSTSMNPDTRASLLICTDRFLCTVTVRPPNP